MGLRGTAKDRRNCGTRWHWFNPSLSGQVSSVRLDHSGVAYRYRNRGTGGWHPHDVAQRHGRMEICDRYRARLGLRRSWSFCTIPRSGTTPSLLKPGSSKGGHVQVKTSPRMLWRQHGTLTRSREGGVTGPGIAGALTLKTLLKESVPTPLEGLLPGVVGRLSSPPGMCQPPAERATSKSVLVATSAIAGLEGEPHLSTTRGTAERRIPSRSRSARPSIASRGVELPLVRYG